MPHIVSLIKVMGRLEELLQLAQCHVSGILQDTPFNRKRHDPNVDVSAAIEVAYDSTHQEEAFIPMVDDAHDEHDTTLRPDTQRKYAYIQTYTHKYLYIYIYVNVAMVSFAVLFIYIQVNSVLFMYTM